VTTVWVGKHTEYLSRTRFFDPTVYLELRAPSRPRTPFPARTGPAGPSASSAEPPCQRARTGLT